jgi:Xaa-Pro aminopeptidase
MIWTVRCQLAVVVATVLVLGHGLGARQSSVEPFGGRPAFLADLAARRARAIEAFASESAVVLWSAPVRVYSDDTNYEYRQESNLLYLTGFSRQDVVLVLVPGASGPREFLFVPRSSPFRELWTGHVPSIEEVRAATGVQAVFAQEGMEAFEAFVRGFLGRSMADAPGADGPEAAGRAAAPSGERVRIALLDYRQNGAPGDSAEAMRQANWIGRLPQPGSGRALTFSNATPRFDTLRQIKTPYEQRVLRRSVEISAEAHIEGMKATRPGRWEYEVEAAIEFWFLKNGALSWGYPSIVGSGPNATTLHYIESSRRMQAGELLLVDAAGNFQGLTGDITRTYPISRRFNPDQKALYELVLAAEEAGIAAARPGTRAADINRAVRRVLGQGLLRLGLVTDPAAADGEGTQIGLWFPHSAVHGIGVDVHDPLGRLDPGAAFVIEPGLYIRPDTLERLEQDPDQISLARALAPAVARYRNIGIRVEDSFLMTATGPENLSVKTPKQVADLERIVGSGRD